LLAVLRMLAAPALAGPVSAQGSGELSLTAVGARADGRDTRRLEARYLPELSVQTAPDAVCQWDAELSWTFLGRLTDAEPLPSETDFDEDPYRYWIRCACEQWRLRAGKQKIAFGPAVLLRPLMWFDSLDPRDPLALTSGVDALLARYFFMNNANLWCWALRSNGERKGWERDPTPDHKPEFGVRFQSPAGPGELAVTYHRRSYLPSREDTSRGEHRLAVDGKWDAGAGLWFEAVCIRRETDDDDRWEHVVTLGADYTFDAGNGLHLLGEHLLCARDDVFLGSGDARSVTAVMADYPLGATDSVSAIVQRDGTGHDWFRYASWRRRTDRWSLHLTVFWNPASGDAQTRAGGWNAYAGKGAQVTAVWNH
jgi:hypothetical protein